MGGRQPERRRAWAGRSRSRGAGRSLSAPCGRDGRCKRSAPYAVDARLADRYANAHHRRGARSARPGRCMQTAWREPDGHGGQGAQAGRGDPRIPSAPCGARGRHTSGAPNVPSAPDRSYGLGDSRRSYAPAGHCARHKWDAHPAGYDPRSSDVPCVARGHRRPDARFSAYGRHRPGDRTVAYDRRREDARSSACGRHRRGARSGASSQGGDPSKRNGHRCVSRDRTLSNAS